MNVHNHEFEWIQSVSKEEGHRLDRIWDNWVSVRRVLVRNCRWTEKCSDGRAKFFNTLSCLCAFILCSNLLTPAKYAHSMLILINCKKWLSRETQVDSTHRSVHIFQNIFFEPLSSKMFWFRLRCHVWTMPFWGDWGWNIFVTLFMKLFKT